MIEELILLQDKDDREFTGKQWPGIVVFPDFFIENVTSEYWSDQVSFDYYYKIALSLLSLSQSVSQSLSHVCKLHCILFLLTYNYSYGCYGDDEFVYYANVDQ